MERVALLQQFAAGEGLPHDVLRARGGVGARAAAFGVVWSGRFLEG
jgi:hypothetical protein